MASQKLVRELHTKRPHWSAVLIAAELNCNSGYVRATARRLGLTLPHHKPDSLISLGIAARDAGLTVERIKELGRDMAVRR